MQIIVATQLSVCILPKASDTPLVKPNMVIENIYIYSIFCLLYSTVASLLSDCHVEIKNLITIAHYANLVVVKTRLTFDPVPHHQQYYI